METATLWCVPPEALQGEPFWFSLVAQACAWEGCMVSAETLWNRVLTDPSYAAFGVYRNGLPCALVVVQRHDEPTLEIVALAGRGLPLVRRLWPMFRDLARYNRCTRIIAGGRRGWARLTGMTIIGRGERGAYRMEERLCDVRDGRRQFDEQDGSSGRASSGSQQYH